MVKKQSKKISGFDLVKTIGYILVIVLIFSPLTFLVSTTITGTVEHDCYRSIKTDIESPQYNIDYDLCQDEYQEKRDEIGQQEFLIVSIISIIAIVSLLLLGSAIDPIISYSLFFASSLNTIIIVIITRLILYSIIRSFP